MTDARPGPNRIDQAFRRLRSEGRTGFIPYVTAGDPSLAVTARLAEALVEAGADLLELGVPFSDPLADGPAIQQASQRALAAGTSLGQVLGLVTALRRTLDVPILLLTYVNPILAYGTLAFCHDAAAAGVDGLVIPDLPLEEAKALDTLAEARGLYRIAFCAPTTPPERMAAIAERARGFIYCVSLTGVTGERRALSAEVRGFVPRLRALTTLPLAVGFGIAGPEQAREAAELADAVIVGSAVVSRVAEGGDTAAIVGRVATFARAVRAALDARRAPA